VVFPYVIPGSVDHMYSDHASILKFIEAGALAISHSAPTGVKAEFTPT
jgi:hypothetical protein